MDFQNEIKILFKSNHKKIPKLVCICVDSIMVPKGLFINSYLARDQNHYGLSKPRDFTHFATKLLAIHTDGQNTEFQKTFFNILNEEDFKHNENQLLRKSMIVVLSELPPSTEESKSLIAETIICVGGQTVSRKLEATVYSVTEALMPKPPAEESKINSSKNKLYVTNSLHSPMRRPKIYHSLVLFGDYLYCIGGITPSESDADLTVPFNGIERVNYVELLESKAGDELWEDVNLKVKDEVFGVEEFYAVGACAVSLGKRIMIFGG